MENQSNKKILSECSDVQCNFYLGHGSDIICVMEEGGCSGSCSSPARTPNTSANALLFSKMLSSSGSPLIRDQPTIMRNANSLTPSKSVLEAEPICERTTDKAMVSEESKNLLKKFRRRSTIGLRGSPENNSLIRHMALQKGISKQDTLTQTSPFNQRSTFLKDKIAAFQSSFKPLEETEEKATHVSNSANEACTRVHEQSKLDYVWPSKHKRSVSEESLDPKSITGERPLADIPLQNVVPPSNKLFIGSVAVSKADPAFLARAVESGYTSLDMTPSRNISKAEHGIQFSHTIAELSIDTTAQHSCKKVRFAEKQRLEIFDETKPPFTPVQKGGLPSSSLRSVLKKTPVKSAECMKADLDDTRIAEEREALSDLKSCGTLQQDNIPKGLTGPVAEGNACNKDLDWDVSITVEAPLCRQKKVPLSPLESREKRSPNAISLKESFSQPNFDHSNVSDLLRESSAVVTTTEHSVNSDLEETKGSSPGLQVVAVRTTRSSTRRKSVSKGKDSSLPTELRAKNSKRVYGRLQKAKEVAKPSKKTPAAKHKAFGKRGRRKKEQKTLYGQRERASKKPLLSPISEMTEELSFMLSRQNTPQPQISILDDSSSGILNTKPTPETVGSNNILHRNDESGSCLHSSLDPLQEDDMSSSSSQLQEDAAYEVKKMLLWDSAEKNSPEKMKNTLNENEQLLSNDYSSSESEVQMVPKLPNLHRSGKNNKSKGESSFKDNSAVELRNESTGVSCKRFPRRSQRLTCYLPSVEGCQSEMPGNSVLESNMEELPVMPQTDIDSELLNSLQCSIEDSFKGVSRRVRRSMRRLKDAENEGLAWIQLPANNSVSQSPLGYACKAQEWRSSSSPQESELLYRKSVNGIRMLLATKEEQENIIGPYKSRRQRKSMSALSLGENKKGLHVWNRRASLVYKSDHAHQKDSEMRKFLENHPVV